MRRENFFEILVFLAYNVRLIGFFGALDDNIQLKDKHVLVIGSETPWLEAILLAKGAKKVTTLGKVETYISIRTVIGFPPKIQICKLQNFHFPFNIEQMESCNANTDMHASHACKKVCYLCNFSMCNKR